MFHKVVDKFLIHLHAQNLSIYCHWYRGFWQTCRVTRILISISRTVINFQWLYAPQYPLNWMHIAPEVIYTCCLAMMVPWMRSESSLLGMFGQGIMQFSGKTYLRLTGTWQSWTHRQWLLSFQSGVFSKPKTCQKNSDNWITMFDIIVEFFLLLLILCVFWDWLALSDFCNSWMSWVSQRTHYFHPKIFSIFSVWTALIFLF